MNDILKVGDSVHVDKFGNGTINKIDWRNTGYGNSGEYMYTVKLKTGNEITVPENDLGAPKVESLPSSFIPSKPLASETTTTSTSDKKYAELKQKYDALLQQYNALKNKFSDISSQAKQTAKNLTSKAATSFKFWGGKRRRRRSTRRKRSRRQKTHKRRR